MSNDKIKGSAILKDAIIDAEKLLSYASEYGIELDEKHIKSIVIAKQSNDKDLWSSEDEVNFWKAFQTISGTVYPVTIDSLRATSKPAKKTNPNWWSKITGLRRVSKVERSVRFYSIFALIAMSIMLVTQIYALIGTALMSKLNNGNQRMIEIEQRMQSLMLITEGNDNDKTARMEQQNLELELDELGEQVESGIQLLNDWLESTYDIWFKTTDETTKAVTENTSSNSPPFAAATAGASRNIVVLQRSKSLITILNQYILPLLYGLLGGLAFVLRSISKDTKMMTYTSISKIKYGLRVHLGALAGLVIGFLWGDLQGKSFGVVESLSPLAVSFIAGYSVEFIFRMLDSLIGVTVNKTEGIKKSSKPDTDKK